MSDDEPDIVALLTAALDDKPPDDLRQRVLDRVAAAKTVLELARLIGIAPVSGMRRPTRPATPAPDDTGPADDADDPDNDEDNNQ